MPIAVSGTRETLPGLEPEAEPMTIQITLGSMGGMRPLALTRPRMLDSVDALTLLGAFAGMQEYEGRPRYAAFFEWLERAVLQCRASFSDDEIPPPLLRYFNDERA